MKTFSSTSTSTALFIATTSTASSTSSSIPLVVLNTKKGFDVSPHSAVSLLSSVRRGGGDDGDGNGDGDDRIGSTNEEDARLDAFIEDLIADADAGADAGADKDKDIDDLTDQKAGVTCGNGQEETEKLIEVEVEGINDDTTEATAIVTDVVDTDTETETDVKKPKKKKKSKKKKKKKQSEDQKLKLSSDKSIEDPKPSSEISLSVDDDNAVSNDSSITATIADANLKPINTDDETTDKVPVSEANPTDTPSNIENEGQQKQPPRDEEKRFARISRPPNSVYRFFLNQGLIGHIIVMIFVLITEFINTYIPPLASFILWLCTLIFGDQEAILNDEARKRRAAGLPPKKVNDRYSAFVAISDGSSVIRGGKKKRKEAIKKDDQKAVQQLKRIGRDAQYRHNSLAFLQRHRIGPFRDDTAVDVKTTTTTTTKTESPKRSTKKRKGIKEDDEEEEVDWVVEALSAKSVQREQSKISSSSSMFKPTVGVSLSDGTPSMEVGLSFSIGGRNNKPTTSKKKKRSTSGSKKKKNRKSVLEAATEQEMTQKKRKKTIISDRDGGIMGRIRDFSANNLVSRSLMGAYPGDAAPPSEAASANGVYQIAEKYGFGDWSDEDDDDDDDEEDHVENTEDRTKRRKRRRRKTVRGGLKTREKNQPTILTTTLLDDPIQDKKEKRPSSSRARSSQRKRSKTRRVKRPAPMMKEEELSLPREGMSVVNRDEKNERTRAELVSALNEKAKTVRLVRPPMEALREAKEQAKIDDTQQ